MNLANEYLIKMELDSEYSDRIRSECPKMEPDPAKTHGSATLDFLYSCPAQFLPLSLSFLVWQQMKFLGAFSLLYVK